PLRNHRARAGSRAVRGGMRPGPEARGAPDRLDAEPRALVAPLGEAPAAPSREGVHKAGIPLGASPVQRAALWTDPPDPAGRGPVGGEGTGKTGCPGVPPRPPLPTGGPPPPGRA